MTPGFREPDLPWAGHVPLMQPGAYRRTQHPDGQWVWFCCTPNGHTADLRQHEVIVHDDGAITVNPSILVSDGERDLWHGYLIHGEWRAC